LYFFVFETPGRWCLGAETLGLLKRYVQFVNFFYAFVRIYDELEE
jgi:hypothetical protein